MYIGFCAKSLCFWIYFWGAEKKECKKSFIFVQVRSLCVRRQMHLTQEKQKEKFLTRKNKIIRPVLKKVFVKIFFRF